MGTDRLLTGRIGVLAPFKVMVMTGSDREMARRYRNRDGAGEIGIIASVTQPFCRGCTRARLSADSELFTCLFAEGGHDLRSIVRSDANDVEIGGHIRAVWQVRTDPYSELRSAETERLGKEEMSYIGGERAAFWGTGRRWMSSRGSKLMPHAVSSAETGRNIRSGGEGERR